MERSCYKRICEELNDNVAASWCICRKPREFVRLADIRLHLVSSFNGVLNDCLVPAVLLKDGLEPYVSMILSRSAWYSPSHRGKIILQKPVKLGLEPSEWKVCGDVFSWRHISPSVVYAIDKDGYKVSSLEIPQWYRCSKEFSSLEPTIGNPDVNTILGVMSEESPKEYFYTHEPLKCHTDCSFDELSQKDQWYYQREAHAEYKEDLFHRWRTIRPEEVCVKKAFGYIVPFFLVSRGGMVITTVEEWEKVANRWQIMDKGLFRQICKQNNWSIQV